MFSGMKLSTAAEKCKDENDDSDNKETNKEDKHFGKTSGFSFINDLSSKQQQPSSDILDVAKDDKDAFTTTTLANEQLDPYYSNPVTPELRELYSADLDGLTFTSPVNVEQKKSETSSFNFIKTIEDEEDKFEDIESSLDLKEEDEPSLDTKQECMLTKQVERLKVNSHSSAERNIQKHVDDIIEDSLHSVLQLLDKQSSLNDIELSEKEALREEDYEKAEELNKSIEQMKLKQQSIIQPHTHANYPWLLSNLKQLTNDEILCQENEAELAKQLKVELELKNEEITVKKRHCEQDIELDIQKRKQKLNTAKGHLTLDQEDVLKCEKLLEDRIAEETKEFDTKKSLLEIQQQCVQDEIEELLKKLECLRKQEKEIKDDIEEQNKLITNVRDGFSNEIQQLEKDQIEIKNREHELNTLESKLTSDEDEMKTKSQWYDKEEKKYDNLLAVVNGVIETNIANLRVLKKTDGQLVPDLTVATLEINQSQCVARLQDITCEGIEKIKNATSSMIFKQTEVTLQTKTLSSLRCQVEEIKVAKQAAVQGKHFSEAKKLSIELKSMVQEIASIEEELEKSREQLEKLKKELSAIRKEQDELETQLDTEEKKQGLQHLDSARSTFQKIKELVSHDDHQPMMTKQIIQAEIQTCSLWIKYLCNHLHVMFDGDAEEYLLQHPVNNDILVCDKHEEERQVIAKLQQALESAIEEENYDVAESIQLEIDTLKTVL
ncbi:uncharacterized protein [Antedon mediterranea]